jgi:hypothetical protein
LVFVLRVRGEPSAATWKIIKLLIFIDLSIV